MQEVMKSFGTLTVSLRGLCLFASLSVRLANSEWTAEKNELV